MASDNSFQLILFLSYISCIDIFPLETDHDRAVALLQGMSVKESFVGLTATEIAGFVAATVYLDTFVRIDHKVEHLTVLGGMGGDKGYEFAGEESKLFSLSTLAAITLSVDVPELLDGGGDNRILDVEIQDVEQDETPLDDDESQGGVGGEVFTPDNVDPDWLEAGGYEPVTGEEEHP